MEHLSIDCWAAAVGSSLETMQAMHYPLSILEEMLRAGKECSITFPIFSYSRIRFDLPVNGGMPVTKELSYQQYDTPNRHFFTSDDVERFCEQKGIKIISRQFFPAAVQIYLPKIYGLACLQQLLSSSFPDEKYSYL